MLSLQPNHQVLYHLSQLSNCLSTTSTTVVNGIKTLNAPKTEKIQDKNDIICSESLEETIKNCSKDVLVYLPKISKRISKSSSKLVSGKDIAEMEELRRTLLLLSPLKSIPLKKSVQAPLEISFKGIKGHDFQKFLSNHNSVYVVASRSHHTLLQPNGLQSRGFKTIRLADKEKERNGMLSQVTDIFRLTKPEIKLPPNMEKLGDSKSVDSIATAVVKIYGDGFTAGKSAEKLRRFRWFVYGLLAGVLVMGVRTFNFIKFKFNYDIKQVTPDEIEATFADVRGSEEVKKELMTVVEFLKNPKKFAALGARLPKGVLLAGEPGVGKTLLARAVAKEAGVPFFFASGSEFDEIYVGEGARRIRKLFRMAKANAPCVIFVDEIDSVGSKRTKSSVHPYADQSINQLLSEMDGFSENEGVIVLAATNRPNALDEALVRPGRFDMSIQVPCPREGDRRDILEYYLQKISCRNIDIDVIVKLTAGWNGSKISNLVNWAAILAAIEDSEYVNMHHMLTSFDRIVLGLSWGAANAGALQKEIRKTAYHEAGHTLVSLLTPGSGPIYKVTIEARGQALGHTGTLSSDDKLQHTKADLRALIDMCFGGQVAEEFIFGSDEVSVGCQQDLERATKIAKAMVRQFGMGVTNRYLDEEESLSAEAQTAIDKDINKILNESRERAKALLVNHATDLHKIAGALLEYKTLSRADLIQLLGWKEETKSSKDQ